ncbi:hypothetical protein PLESTB_000073500 [Pleodorina starrii]|uniref:DNA (cytosine-5-)-methyltransferase n=1 Tax=Pleodorina starrii TaxID=330485 RepID=A0A9W6BAM0_9CHLO|nr:hypothetical protein PLESTB_000073500 [Pleodorina starrii]GLC66523.1 hypothetical protein PLESTF_000439800 [Pleodorina starrii]
MRAAAAAKGCRTGDNAKKAQKPADAATADKGTKRRADGDDAAAAPAEVDAKEVLKAGGTKTAKPAKLAKDGAGDAAAVPHGNDVAVSARGDRTADAAAAAPKSKKLKKDSSITVAAKVTAAAAGATSGHKKPEGAADKEAPSRAASRAAEGPVKAGATAKSAAGSKRQQQQGEKRPAAEAAAKSDSEDSGAGQDDGSGGGADAAAAAPQRGRGGGGTSRKAVQRVKSYREDTGEGDQDEEMEEAEETVEVKEAATEEEALRLTAPAGSGAGSGGTTTPGGGGALRRLVDFKLVDGEGRLEPLEQWDRAQGGLYICGSVEAQGPPVRGAGRGVKSRGQAAGTAGGGRCRVASLGPIREWSVKYSGAGTGPQLVLRTDRAAYECGKPAAPYRKMLEQLMAQLELAGAVHRSLCPAAGGRLDASFDDVCRQVARTKVSKQYGGARFALMLNGRFIKEQLTSMAAASQPQGSAAAAAAAGDKGKGTAPADKGKGKSDATCTYDNGPFARGLREALETEEHTLPCSRESLALLTGGGGGGIRINTDGGGGGGNDGEGAGGAGGALVDGDEELARRLQAEEVAEHMNGGGADSRNRRRGGGGGGRAGGGGGGGSKEPYIQVREVEIVDDYPEPKEYVVEEGEDEWDELVLEDPDLLGCGHHGADEREGSRTLDHFAIYNSEGFLTTLELVPMVPGLQADVNIFASGVLAEDTGDWGAEGGAAAAAEQQQAGGSGAGGSGAGGSGGPDGGGSGGSGQRYFLTQIREWFVECGPGGQVVINIRTDVSWYRLLRPQKRYAPWFRVVQRVASIAVQILTWLDEQDRASRLSFSDIVARLSALPPNHPARMSSKADVVGRFVSVHGQVILNLIGRHYKDTIRRCGFAQALRTKLAERQHWKLTSGGKGGRHTAAGGFFRNKKAVENPVTKLLKEERKKKGRPEQMPATTTAQVRRIWSDYFVALDARVGGQQQQQEGQEGQDRGGDVSAAGAAGSAAGPVGTAGGANGAGGAAAASAAAPAAASAAASASTVLRIPQVRSKIWTLTERRPGDKVTGRTLYGAAVCGDLRLTPGSIIRLGPGADGGDSDSEGSDDQQEAEEEEEEGAEEGAAVDAEAGAEGSGAAANGAAAAAAAAARAAARRLELLTRGPFGLVQCIFTESEEDGEGEGSPQIQIRRVVHGRDTVLGSAAAPSELFLLDRTPAPPVPTSRGGGGGGGGGGTAATPAPGDVAVWSLNGRCVADVLEARLLSRSGHHSSRLGDAKADMVRLAGDAERVAAGQPPLFVYRSVYCPLQGKFRELRIRDLALGSYIQPAPSPAPLALLPGGAGFIKDGVAYRVGDFLYVPAAALDEQDEHDSDSDSAEDDSDDDDDDDLDSDGRDEFVDEDEEQQEVDEEVRHAARRGRRRTAARCGGAKAGTKGGDAAKKPRGVRAAKKVAKAASEGEKEEEEDEEKEEEEAGEEAGPKRRRATGRRTTHKGSNEGLRAFQVVQLLRVEAGTEESRGGAKGKAASAAATAVPTTLHVRRFYRPEDVSLDVGYRADWWDLYAPAAANGSGKADGTAAAPLALPVGEVYGKCSVIVGRPRPSNPKLDTFVVVGSYDPAQRGKTGPPPASLAPPQALLDALPLPAAASGVGGKGKGRTQRSEAEAATLATAAGAGGDSGSAGVEAAEGEGEGMEQQEEDDEEVGAEEWATMDSLDIFAGCGGLSEGMHQAGVARTRWAIEFDDAAAAAFKLNNPDAKVFCNNCNVLLRAAMVKAGQAEDCLADPRVVEAVARLDEQVAADLPAPGAVGFMMGGPPCQGYSGMNRHNGRLWSQMQNTMVMGYLSYCDFYRPRYFLLENVRNFVCYRGGEVFRLVVRTLLDMGYQVRFGILNAGHFGAPQSRKRTFIWAALPGELLPDWPTPRHVFSTAQLGVRMQPPGGGGAGPAGNPPSFYAVGSLTTAAPLRTVTVRDAIWDLPPVDNDARTEVLPYTGEPQSAFQRAIRAQAGSELRDHIVRQLNAVNLERCRCIPKGKPGADWRELQKIVERDPSREFFNGEPLVPFCLPRTAHRHNGWRGLYGRLDPEGHFPTATTDPYPMGKVGQVLHPSQDRIVSVRECARSQGFPDHFQFYGDASRRHRQVGNAVPPPLARALGQQLRLALKERRARDAREAAEQMQALRARRQQQKGAGK